MKKYAYKILIIIGLAANTSWAQTNFKVDTTKIALMPRTASDSITLRWVVDNFTAFKMGMTGGYTVFRAEQTNGTWSRFAPVATVKAWTKNDWQNHLSRLTDTSANAYKFASAAYELVIDENANPTTNLSDLDAIRDAKAQSDLTFLFVTLAACSDREVANGLAVRWVDKTVQSGKKYRYRVEFANYTSKKAVFYADAEAQAVPHQSKAAAKITAIENENSIILNWKIGEEPFFSYNLERSDDNGKTFRRLNDMPIFAGTNEDEKGNLIGTLADTTCQMYKPYIYRIIGNTLFADQARIGDIRAMALDRTPVNGIFVPSPEQIAPKKVKITWELTTAAPDLAGFRVRRDTGSRGNFDRVLHKTLLTPKTNSFVDENFSGELPNYYVVETVDTAGNIFRSPAVFVTLIDSIPPSVPRITNAKMDSNGVVTLRLQLNREKDFMGYRVYRANQADHEFSLIRETFDSRKGYFVGKDSVILDTVTLNTLTANVFYRVVALDFHHNESKPSAPIRLTRPDTIPPVAPIIQKIEVSDTALVLNIIPSSSKDVKTIKLLRKKSGEPNWTNYATLKTTDTRFADRNVEAKTTYEYALQAIDSNNLQSPLSFVLRGRTYQSSVRTGVENLEANYDRNAKAVILTWKYAIKPTKTDEKTYFLIYRSWANEKLERYMSVPADGKFEFQDKDFTNKGKYNYSIKVMTDTGAESGLSAKMVAIVE